MAPAGVSPQCDHSGDGVEQPVQVGDGELDVVVAALAGAGLCGQQATTVELS